MKNILFFIYNIAQFLALSIFSPVILILLIINRRLRKKIGQRLFFHHNIISNGQKRIWVHALSVGEVTSTVPLLRLLKTEFPQSVIILSSTTTTGRETAQKLAAPYVDHLIRYPVDILFSIQSYLNRIQPDLYIHIETDFWPNLLFLLHKRNIPALLFNGRMSKKSVKKYRMLSFFIRPMFDCFTTLCMQSEKDRENMISLGLSAKKVLKLGNLKLVIESSKKLPPVYRDLLNDSFPLFLCGSTHPGEEKLILEAIKLIRKQGINFQLLIAPRKKERGREIKDLCHSLCPDLTCELRSKAPKSAPDILIIDTLGELNSLYQYAQIAFIGGTLINEGGHNPIEPASAGIPILFGPYYNDFHEICQDLLDCNGGYKIKDSQELASRLAELLADEKKRKQRGYYAKSYVKNKEGIGQKHIDLIKSLF